MFKPIPVALTITEPHKTHSSSTGSLPHLEGAVTVGEGSQRAPLSKTKEVGARPEEPHPFHPETVNTVAQESPTTKINDTCANKQETTAKHVEQCQLNKSFLSRLEDDEYIQKHQTLETNRNHDNQHVKTIAKTISTLRDYGTTRTPAPTDTRVNDAVTKDKTTD